MNKGGKSDSTVEKSGKRHREQAVSTVVTGQGDQAPEEKRRSSITSVLLLPDVQLPNLTGSSTQNTLLKCQGQERQQKAEVPPNTKPTAAYVHL